MLVKKDLLNNFGEAIGEYFISTKDEVKVTLNGKTVVEKDLAPDDQNALSKYTDAFEDGFNHVTNGEEWYEAAGFRFSRPAYDESAGLSRVESCGNVRGHYDVDIVKINGRRYALDGWNGEKYANAYEVNEAGHAIDPTGPSHTATPVYKQLGEDEFEIIDYDIG